MIANIRQTLPLRRPRFKFPLQSRAIFDIAIAVGRKRSRSLFFTIEWKSKGARMAKERNGSFFPRRAANAGITNRRPAARQRPAVLKQTAFAFHPVSLSPLYLFLPLPFLSRSLSLSLAVSLPLLSLPSSPPGRVYMRAPMANRDWPAVNAPFVPN